MCGIIGAIETRSGVLDFMKNGVMHSYIGKRGPDNYSFNVQFIDNWKISLAHSRLSIIDVSELSNQPMVSESEEIIMIYNGEIYNYLEIRSELQSLGIHFVSTGDSEVLLKAWEMWGENCLTRLNGMFAFAVLNKRERCLYLIRDRFGVKPLVFGIADSGELVFSSSITAVTSVLKKQLNFNYISR
jgi:asparagine synthase (glutamine-hydrolysing)